jgi:hypothetical protein
MEQRIRALQSSNRWSGKDWESLFKALADDPDFEHIMIDATIIGGTSMRLAQKGDSK